MNGNPRESNFSKAAEIETERDAAVRNPLHAHDIQT